MNDSVPVSFIQRIRDLDGVLESLADRQWPLLYTLSQNLTLQVLHDEKMDSVVSPDVIQRTDMRMAQTGDGVFLAVETFAELRTIGERFEESLYCNDSIEACISCPVDLAHPARANKRDNLVGA